MATKRDPRAEKQPFQTLRRQSSSSRSANPPTPPERPTPQRTVQEKFFISTTYSTIAARALSFQGQVLNGVTPLQLAQNGFHYQPFSNGGMACCFACQSAKRLNSFQRVPFHETQQLHLVDCIWQVIYRDLNQHLESAETQPSSNNASPPPRQSAHSPYLSSISEHEKTTTNDSTQTQFESIQTVATEAKEHSYDDLHSRAQPPSTTTNPESHSLPPNYSPRPPRPTPTTTSLAHSHQPTYASVLRHSTTTSSRSIPEPPEPVLPNRPILTVEDLHCRFYNKPSPFLLESKTRKRSTSRTCNKPVSATNSLSNFLTSALPAFSRFLAEMQPKSDTCFPSHPRIHYSRAMRAAITNGI